MSLINEALRRAEEEKLEKTSLAGDAPLLAPVQTRGRVTISRALIVRMVIGLGVVSAAFAAFRVLTHGSGNERVKAVATVSAAPVGSKPALAAPAVRPGAQADNPGKTVKAASSARTGALASQPSHPRPAEAEKPVGRPGADLAATGPSSNAGINQPTTQPAVGKSPKVAKTAHEPSRAEADPMPVEDKPKVVGLMPNTSDYKVSGIMVGLDGPMAIINGRPVRTGEKLGRATVVQITPYTVVLDVSGHRFSVGM
jgi:hypothetical protein